MFPYPHSIYGSFQLEFITRLSNGYALVSKATHVIIRASPNLCAVTQGFLAVLVAQDWEISLEWSSRQVIYGGRHHLATNILD